MKAGIEIKKTLSVLCLLLTVCVLLSGCSLGRLFPSGQDSGSLDDLLVSKSADITRTLDTLAENYGYIQMITPNPEIMDILEGIGRGDYEKLDRCVIVSFTDDMVKDYTSQRYGDIDLSGDAEDIFISKFVSSVPSLINASYGVVYIAAASVLTAGKTYQAPKDFAGNYYVVLVYDNGYSTMTSFRASGDGIVSAATSFVFLNGDLLEAIDERILDDYIEENFGFKGVDIKYLSGADN